MVLRSPIITVLGHVDHGKSSLLDTLRDSNIVASEAGSITQAIGASIITTKTIKKKIGKLVDTLSMEWKIPGLLFIDTPGHAAFTSLRSRGGNLADIAILVVDINEGFKPQTKEAIDILKNAKTPFIIAANKLDLVPGFINKDTTLLQLLSEQQEAVSTIIENKLYELVGTLYEKYKLQAERFDRVEDYTKQVAIIPISATKAVGIKELLMVLSGLAQKYLEGKLLMNPHSPAKGIILEVKEEKGIGKTIDAIMYDGTLSVGDTIVFGTLDTPKITKVRALFEPQANTELRDKKGKFQSVKHVVAATGVKISAPDLEGAAAGMPLISCTKDAVEAAQEEITNQVHNVQIRTEKEGVVIKADTLGSLEALIHMLKERKIPIRKATVGSITNKDITDAESNLEKHPLFASILGFNIPQVEANTKVHIITHDVIYKLLDDFEEWQQGIRKELEAKNLDGLVRPCKVEVLQNCLFRISNPCIVGVEVLKGELKTGMPLMTEKGMPLTLIKSIQTDKENLKQVESGRQVAISLPNITAGRHINENEFLYSDIPEDHFRKLKNLVEHLSPQEKETLKKVAEIKRQHNPIWGV